MIAKVLAVLFALLVFGFFIWFIIASTLDNKHRESVHEKSLLDLKGLLKKFGVPEDDYIELHSFKGHPLIDGQSYKKHLFKAIGGDMVEYHPRFLIWITRNHFNILRTNILHEEVAPLVQIPLTDFQSYRLEGDVNERMYISGGGGGGSSLKGAVIGGAVAGVPGAIIGSRRKVEPIKTTYKTEDLRFIEMKFRYGNMIKIVVATKQLYGYLLKHIPNKSL
jgi:hypothetical protein